MILKPDYIPAGYDGIQVVDTMGDVFNTPFGTANCILFPRRLTGDFNGLAREMYNNWLKLPILQIEEISKQSKSDGITQAAQIVLEDIKEYVRRAEKAKAIPNTELRVEEWPRPTASPGRFYEFHPDESKDRVMGRVLSCYDDLVTEWARNEDIISTYSFREGPRYNLKPGAKIEAFRAGDIWRHAVLSGPVKAFMHRTPHTGQTKNGLRMLFIGG